MTLDGPTKYNEDCERYLRLYGILSATYIQQEAVLKLYQLMNVPPTLKGAKNMIDTLEIRLLRHKLCSHSTNYYDANRKAYQTYVPIRSGLNGFNCMYVNNEEYKNSSVDLQKAVNDHLEAIIELMDRILDKAIKTLYKGQKKCQKCMEFSEKIEDLRFIRKGGSVSKLPNGTKLIIN